MNPIAKVPLLFLLLASALSCSFARSLNERNYGNSVNADDSSSARATEFRDLFSAGNSPKKSVNDKKHMKNASGKSDEGGFYKTYGSDAEGEKGYLKQTYSKGDHGYKTFDTFHKKNGDNYGFEEHTAFGKGREGKKAEKDGKSGSYTSEAGDDDDHEGAGTIVETHYAEGDGNDGESTSYAEEGGNVASGESAGNGAYYASDGSGEHYTEGGDGENSDGYNESYSSGGGDEGSYGSSSSYSSDGEGGGDGYYGGAYY